MSTGVKAHVAGSCGCKAGWFERWLSRPLIGLFPSIIYLCIGLRCRRPEGLGKLMMLSAKEEKGKTFEKLGIHVKSKKHN